VRNGGGVFIKRTPVPLEGGKVSSKELKGASKSHHGRRHPPTLAAKKNVGVTRQKKSPPPNPTAIRGRASKTEKRKNQKDRQKKTSHRRSLKISSEEVVARHSSAGERQNNYQRMGLREGSCGGKNASKHQQVVDDKSYCLSGKSGEAHRKNRKKKKCLIRRHLCIL